jgi:xanthine dehydrogenase accessory factor
MGSGGAAPEDEGSEHSEPREHSELTRPSEGHLGLYAALRERLRTEQPVGLATVIDGPGIGNHLLIGLDGQPRGTLGNAELDRITARDTLAELEAGRSGIRHYGPDGQTTPADLIDTPVVQVFIETWAPPPQMWIFGAVDFTAALARVAKVLGYRVTVCDAREVFATRRRFPMADEVVVSWPSPLFTERGSTLSARDAVAILTHDPKFDVPAVQGALATDVGYIGVMGSRHTHATRLERLAEAGIDRPEQLSRLMAPIGLDLGARTPEETAVSICAEIIALRHGRRAASLRDAAGTIH